MKRLLRNYRNLVLITAALSASLLTGQVHYVPLYHSVYRVLDQWFASGLATPTHQQQLYTRQAVLTWLEEAAQKTNNEKTLKIIDRYLREFRDGEIHTLTYLQGENGLYGDAILRGTIQGLAGKRPFQRLDVGGNIRGYLGSSLSFQTDIVTTVFLGNLDLKTGYGIKESLAPVKHHKNESNASTDWVQSQVIASFPWGYFSFGSDQFDWGPGRSGNLLLDLDQYPLTNVHAVVSLGRFRFSQVLGTLDKLYPYIEDGRKRYLADQRKLVAHRLDVFLSPKIQFGVSESVVYNRGIELAYLNPLIPLTASEVEAGDLDNNLAAVDFTARFTPHTRTYFELLTDDLNFNQNFFTAYGNKWSVLFGQQWANPFRLEDLLLTLEVIRVEPWVYTHRDTANHYEYYGQSIGYNLEPNSLKVYAGLDWFVRPNLWCRITYQNTRHGKGDRIFGNPPDRSAPKNFLKGKVENRSRVDFELDYEFYQNMWLRLRLWFESVRNERIDDTFAEFKGDHTTRGIAFTFDLNY